MARFRRATLALLRGWLPATAPAATNYVVAFTTTNSTPLNLGFAGFCTAIQTSAVEYGDTNFQAMAAALSPGWLRYPGGSTDDAFFWTNGLTLTNSFSEFPAWETNLLWPAAKLGNGKGGVKFPDLAALCQNVGGAKIVVTINGFTDTAASPGRLPASLSAIIFRSRPGSCATSRTRCRGPQGISS